MRLLVLCLLSVTAANLQGYEGQEQQETNSLNRVQYPFGQSEIPEYEIVIARYKENSTTLAWLSELPPFYQITIINKVHQSFAQSNANLQS